MAEISPEALGVAIELQKLQVMIIADPGKFDIFIGDRVRQRFTPEFIASVRLHAVELIELISGKPRNREIQSNPEITLHWRPW